MLKNFAVTLMLSYVGFGKQAAYEVVYPREQRKPDVVRFGKVLS